MHTILFIYSLRIGDESFGYVQIQKIEYDNRANIQIGLSLQRTCDDWANGSSGTHDGCQLLHLRFKRRIILFTAINVVSADSLKRIPLCTSMEDEFVKVH